MTLWRTSTRGSKGRLRGAALLGVTALLTAALPAGPAQAARSSGIRLNQIQVIGTHNSYHEEPTPQEFSLISSVAGPLAGGLQYTHPTLGRQLAVQRVRQIELDVYADPSGGRFATPLIRRLTGQPAEYDPVLREPGTKVLHIPDVDYRGSCLTFTDCLRAVRDWSRGDPHHLPVAVLVEFKDTLDIPIPGAPPEPLVPWTRERMLGLEQEIASVFARSDLLTPDDVRRPGRTLEQSVLSKGWPTLGALQGKVMFLMDNEGVYRDRYLQGNPSLEGRLLFTNGQPGHPDAAFVKRNDPLAADGLEIDSLVRRGYVVRTRADVDTVQARVPTATGDTRMRDAALASGAQWVSTDYPVPGIAARFGSGYVAALPGGLAARCNPVTAPPRCALPPRDR